MDKSQLRREARRRRRGIAITARAEAEQAIAALVHERQHNQGWRRVAAYVGTGSEASLAPWFARCTDDATLFLPAIDADDRMCFREWMPGQPLVDGPFGIAQPLDTARAGDASTSDMMLLPLLGFDRSGTRLGSGAGYYDRALAAFAGRSECPRLVGVAFSVQQFDALPRDPWDIPLDAVVTECGWLDLPA